MKRGGLGIFWKVLIIVSLVLAVISLCFIVADKQNVDLGPKFNVIEAVADTDEPFCETDRDCEEGKRCRPGGFCA